MSNLKAIRERVGLTQSALADAVGLTQGAIAHYENARRQPGLVECRKILLALNAAGASCTLDEVFLGPAPSKKSVPIESSQEEQPEPEGFVERRRPGAQSHAGIRTGRRATDATQRDKLLALAAAKRGEFPE